MSLPEMTDPDELLRDAINEYFEDLHITLWGSAYSIIDPVERKWATNWFLTQFRSVLDRWGEKLLVDETLVECLKRGNPRRGQSLYDMLT